jgi:hypothetical protein
LFTDGEFPSTHGSGWCPGYECSTVFHFGKTIPFRFAPEQSWAGQRFRDDAGHQLGPLLNQEMHMYQKPTLERFGTFRDLTLAGCIGSTDGASLPGIGNSTGGTPIITGNVTSVCFAGSR